jgi:hypothetical protein
VKARERARDIRAAALVELRRMSETGRGAQTLPWLFHRCAEEPALMRLHVWQVSQAIYGLSDKAAKHQVRTAARWCGTDLPKPGNATLAWLLDGRTDGARLSAWLLAVALDLGYRLKGPDPYHVQPASTPAAAVPSLHQTVHSDTPHAAA